MSESIPAGMPGKSGPVFAATALLRDAWTNEALSDRSPRGRVLALIRVIGTTVKGILYNKIPVQAAALTYYTLMSIGPMLVLALTLGGFILSKQENGHAKLKDAISSAIHSLAPQTQAQAAASKSGVKPAEVESKPQPAAGTDAKIVEQKAISTGATTPEIPAAQPVDHTSDDAAMLDLDKLVDNLLTQAANGGVSAIGLVILVFLAVMMLSRVENAFNAIWSVHKGRRWTDRFINYFLFMVVSCVLGAASLTMLSGSSFAKQVEDLPKWLQDLPGLTTFLTGAGPTIISLAMMTALVALFNKFMPNARVRWIPALGGGFLVAVILVTNQKLAALYAGKVASFNKFYGSLSIILVLMFGMYLSWLFLLIGGQFTFALQNARALAAYRTWESLSARTKQTLCFGCLVMIARRFRAMEMAPDSDEMATVLRVPRSITDQCLARLIELKLVIAVDDGDSNPDNDRYRPDFPLQAITVAQIKDRLESYSGNLTLDAQVHSDAALSRFNATYKRFDELDDARLSLDALLAQTEVAA